MAFPTAIFWQNGIHILSLFQVGVSVDRCLIEKDGLSFRICGSTLHYTDLRKRDNKCANIYSLICS